MLFADVPPPIETTTQSNPVSHVAFTTPVTSLKDKPIREIQITVRGGKTQQWKLAQNNNQDQSPSEVLEITADKQTFDPDKQVVTAQGNVRVEFAQGVLLADQLRINLESRLAVGTGNVTFQRGEQILRGQRFEYNFGLDSGRIVQAGGEIFQPSLEQDLAIGFDSNQSDSNRIEEPVQDVQPQQGVQFSLGGGPDVSNLSVPEGGGTISRFRFEADELELDGGNWNANNLRITNDPFSPPELELRAENAKFRQIGPSKDELVASDLRLVFDDGFSIPIPRERIVFDGRERGLNLVNVGFDGDERGGLFIEREFPIIEADQWDFSLTPQYFLQQGIFDKTLTDPEVFGLKANLQGRFSPRTALSVNAALIGISDEIFQENFQGRAQLQQAIGRDEGKHTLNIEASFRERFFSGSLGFQRVQSSFGALITSPTFTIADTGIAFNYEAGIKRINADTDVEELLDENRDNDRVTLTRYQLGTQFSWDTPLWQGDTLPATPDQGLRFTPTPVRPNLRFKTNLAGITTFYSNGDQQNFLDVIVGLEGELGHFSEDAFDYTGFDISYRQAIGAGESPFEFDRLVDRRRLSMGVIQQIYGPFLLGFDTSFNLDNGEFIRSDIILEYSRRTYNLRLSYDPTLQIGSFTIQINGFNWRGSSDPFDEINTGVPGGRR